MVWMMFDDLLDGNEQCMMCAFFGVHVGANLGLGMFGI